MESDDGRTEGGHSDVFPIIGVGASAGGVEACSQLMSGLPGDTGMAFVIVLHLDPRHESNLAHILGKLTPMPVVDAADGMPVQPNRVYVIPPNSTMVLKGGGLRVTPRGRPGAVDAPRAAPRRPGEKARPERRAAV